MAFDNIPLESHALRIVSDSLKYSNLKLLKLEF